MYTKIIDSKIKNSIDYKTKMQKGDRHISMAIMSSFAVLTIEYFILYFFNIAESSTGAQVQVLSKAIVGVFFILALPIITKRSLLIFVSTYTISVFIFLINYLMFPQNSEALKSIFFPLFFTCLPSFIYSFSIDDKNIFMNIVYKVSNIVFIVGLLIGILVFMNKMSIGTYSMSLSYYMLLPAIINLYKNTIKISTSSIVKFITSLLLIIALGSRGAIMCLGVYIIFLIIKNNKKITYKSLLLLSIGILIIFLGIIYFDNIVEALYNVFLNYGIHSRTLDLFMHDILHLSGRNHLYDTIIQQIIENPLIGIGIAGDRVFLGGYTHNIFIEILADFGIIIGSILIIILLLICYKAIKNKNKLDSDIAIIWFCIGFIPLLVSSSYLINFQFWIFLGLAVRSIMVR